jgi:hypothetical protein
MKKIIKALIIFVFLIGLSVSSVFFILEQKKVTKNELKITEENLPKCIDKPANSIELGYPHIGGDVAEFTTNGSEIYITARKFEHGGVMDPPKWLVDVYVGRINELPNWDRERDIITNITSKITFEEGSYGKLKLEPGRYWLWSGGNDILAISCEPNGVSDPKPVQ